MLRSQPQSSPEPVTPSHSSAMSSARQLDPSRPETRFLSVGLDEHDLVGCDTHITCLDNKSEYTALSYVWGDSNEPRTLSIHGQQLHPTTKNLESALRHLIEVKTPFWLDAMCINRSNLAEKPSTIPLTGNIYASAARIVIRLGESDPIPDRPLPLSAEPEDPQLCSSWAATLLVVQELVKESPDTGSRLSTRELHTTACQPLPKNFVLALDEARR